MPNDLAGDPRGTLKVEGRHGPRSVIRVKLGEHLHWDLDGATITGCDVGGRERILAYLNQVNIAQTADEITAGIGLKRKTVQNLLADMHKEVPQPFAVSGKGTKNDPRRFRTLSPRFDGFAADDTIPPDPPPYRGGVGGESFSGSRWRSRQ